MTPNPSVDRNANSKAHSRFPTAVTQVSPPLTTNARPYLRTIAWLTAVFVNASVVATFAFSALEIGTSTKDRIIGFAVAAIFLAVVAFLVSARVSSLPSWGAFVMHCLCIGIPFLWLLASLDYGIVSGKEILSVLLVSLLTWGTWHAFKRCPPRA